MKIQQPPDTNANNINKKVLFTICTDVVMPMCKLIEYTGNYLKTSGSLWLYCRDKPSLNNESSIIDFGDNDTTVFFKSKEK